MTNKTTPDYDDLIDKLLDDERHILMVQADDAIIALRSKLNDYKKYYCSRGDDLLLAWEERRQLIKQINALKAENETLHKNAERYRWLKNNHVAADLV